MKSSTQALGLDLKSEEISDQVNKKIYKNERKDNRKEMEKAKDKLQNEKIERLNRVIRKLEN